jgi:AhpD family alkylhydroperoxidase
LLDAVRASLGATPNMTLTMARSAVLEGYLGLSGALSKGSISTADGERIALAVAEYNACAYCLSAHTYLGTKVAHLSEDEIPGARHFTSSDPRSAAVLAFAAAVLQSRGGVANSDVESARVAGLGDEELSEIVGHVAVNVLTNYFNRAFEVDVDFPVVQPAPARRMTAPAILPPFTEETARRKVQLAEDVWNTRDPDTVALAYTEDTLWRNRDRFFEGREAVRAFLRRKWQRELDYRLRKELWAFAGNRISVRFEYESRDVGGQWWRSHGNEHWEFDEDTGLMRRRDASINDYRISASDRRIGVA